MNFRLKKLKIITLSVIFLISTFLIAGYNYSNQQSLGDLTPMEFFIIQALIFSIILTLIVYLVWSLIEKNKSK